jgi:hypothetical protein
MHMKTTPAKSASWKIQSWQSTHHLPNQADGKQCRADKNNFCGSGQLEDNVCVITGNQNNSNNVCVGSTP